MAYEYRDIINAQFQNIDAAQAQAAADLESARHAEDADRVNEAANVILQLDLQRNALRERAQGYNAAQQSAPQNRYGLSQEEREIAHASFTDRKDMPPMSLEDRERAYAVSKNKYRSMLANGSYSNQRS
jgi:hypothetical protein